MRLFSLGRRRAGTSSTKPRETMNQTQPRERVWDLLIRVVQELFDDMLQAADAFRDALVDHAVDTFEDGVATAPRALRDVRRIVRALDRAETHALEVLRLRATVDTMHLGLGLSAPRTSLDDSLSEVLERVERYAEDARYFSFAALQREDVPLSGAHHHLVNLREMLGLLRALLAIDSHDADHLPRLSACAVVEYADGCTCEHCLPAREAAAVERGQRAMMRGSDAN
jgi:hypothetical protein